MRSPVKIRSDRGGPLFDRQALRSMSLGWELALPIFMGVLLGHFLDTWLVTGYVFTLGCLFWGFAVSAYGLWRFAQRAAEQTDKRQE